MLPTIVLIAEGLVAIWFLLFLTLITSGYLEGRSYGIAKKSPLEKAFLRHVRLFVVAGISIVVLMSISDIAGFTSFS